MPSFPNTHRSRSGLERFARGAGRHCLRAAALFVAAAALSKAGSPQAENPVSVLTQHNNNYRTGANLEEKVLSTSNVNASQFGKLFTRTVDGEIYAQPLYVPNLGIPNRGARNVVIVCTMHNSVYAFDADDPLADLPLWEVNLGPTVPSRDVQTCCPDISTEIGILSTPVIDREAKTMYVLARNKLADGSYRQVLHALEITTGQEKLGGPREITAAGFDPKIHNQRAGLLLLNGVVYIAWASHNDSGSYHGWVIGYDAATLQQVSVWNSTNAGYQAGIWQSGGGLSADADGNIYFITGNGDYDGVNDFGESFVKLTPGPSPSVIDWFTPHNFAKLNETDEDLGSARPLLIPARKLILGGGKEGVLYVLSTDNMGHYNASGDTQILQSWKAFFGHLHGGPVYWRSETEELIYLWSEEDYLRVFRLANGFLQTTPAYLGTAQAPPGMPGGILSLSADGDRLGTGILWATTPISGDANKGTVAGILRAFDASDVSKELWNSEQYAEDSFGNLAKFCPPTIANGKVYLATFSNTLAVYGLLPAQRPPLSGSGPEIISVELPSGKVGQPYEADLQATGVQPMAWSLGSGQLPPGLTLSLEGEIDGVPTRAGDFRFEVRVSDRYDQSASRTLWVVVDPSEGIVVTTPAAGEEWLVRRKHTVAWSSTPGVNKVSISISRDGGSTWTLLQEEIDASVGSVRLKAPKPRTDAAMIRVADSRDGSIVGHSGVFQIK